MPAIAVGTSPCRHRRFLLSALAAAVLAATLSGCLMIKSQSSSQLDVIGKVRLTTVICASDSASNNAGYNPADSACQGNTPAKLGNSGADSLNNFNHQVKIAYRISTGAIAPNSFTSVNTSGPPTTPCGGGIVFTKNTSYGNAIQALSPAGAGKQWVGYLSTVQNFTLAGCQYITVAPEFTLAQFLNVVPFQSPFDYRVAVGMREVNESQPGNTSARTVTCGSSLYAIYLDGVDGADAGTDPDMRGICFDNPDSATVATNLSQSTRDLGVIGTNTSVDAGATANVPFNLWYNGAAGAGPFSISASTNVPGTTATPSITTLTPAADSQNNMTVSVPVPANTPPGAYTVNVTATLGSQTRGIVPFTLTVGESFNFSPGPTLPSLGTITLNAQAQTKNATMSNFGVIDSPGSSDQGWNVTIVGDTSGGKPGKFAQYCPGPGACGSTPAGQYVSSGYQLLNGSLNLNTSSGSWSGGTGTAPTFECNAVVCPIDAASVTKIAKAPNGGGTALWSASGFNSSSLALSTPSTLRALPASDVYHLHAVWTLNSGP